MHGHIRKYIFAATILLFVLVVQKPLMAVDFSKMCMFCHAGKGTDKIDIKRFKESEHGNFACIDCHEDATIDHSSKPDVKLEKVECWNCHDDIISEFRESVHGEAALKRKDRFAPTCVSCHGNHYILPPSNPESATYTMNIPAVCGSCHKEGSEMMETHLIDQTNVIENYSMSIHGEGLFKRGLIVTAVCTNCHGAHDILPHEHLESKINKSNIASTCMQCHTLIEKVHEKIIQGQLWQKEPDKVPVCVECHSPHKVRRVIYDKPITDTTCLSCHSDPNIKMHKNDMEVSLHIERSEMDSSVHADISCVKCHYDVNPLSNPVCKNVSAVDCSICHAYEVESYSAGVHGKLLELNEDDAPGCVDCHGTHNVLSKKEPASSTFPRNVPYLCGRCHRKGEKAALRRTTNASQTEIVNNYTMSIHGKALFESGLMVTAVCANCHTAHTELPADDPASSVHPDKIAETCATCHFGINEQFKESIHSKEVSATEKRLPVCNDCHGAHTIKRVDVNVFRFEVTSQCGGCHEELTNSYFETYHGKASKLGGQGAAKCSDCHGSHNILPLSDPRSTLHHNNIIETCKKCHPGSNRKFVGYLTHATHHDKGKYPALFYSFWFMTILLIGTFSVFGVHTILWFIRTLITKYRKSNIVASDQTVDSAEEKYYLRFKPAQRILHVMVIISFLGLALTGMTLKFPDINFFEWLSQLLGGPVVSGIIHRVCAVITFLYFFTHLFIIAGSLKLRKITLRGLFKEEYTMLPLKRDFREMKEHFLWFLGKGPRPKFGRWTYWEKFDYFAVFWGVAIIGSTGLILWFPELATKLLPGLMINVATVIHSDEALLATGFIFTIHFFNTHFRHGKFPMDLAIFTGKIPVSELKDERAREYGQLIKKGELDKHIKEPPPKWLSILAKCFGAIFLIIGLVVVAAIIYAMVIVYR